MSVTVKAPHARGDRVRVYCRVDDFDRLCEWRHRHRVPVLLARTLQVTAVVVELVADLHYDRDGHGEVMYAVDKRGFRYIKRPHWDGPRGSSWQQTSGRIAWPEPSARWGFAQLWTEYPRLPAIDAVTGRRIEAR